MNIHAMLNPDDSEARARLRSRTAPQREASKKPKPSLVPRRSHVHKYKHRRPQHEVESPNARSHRHASKRAKQKQEAVKHSRGHKKTPSVSSISSSGTSAARLLLDQARETIQNDPGSKPHGRKPLVMDVILDSLPPPTEFREDILMEALERSQLSVLPTPPCPYTFKDEHSLDAYWADQAEIWKERHGDRLSSRPLTQSKISAERSTALWTCPSGYSSDSDCDRDV
ncbi:hypothetical protein OE88DRAFT_1641473 [Heliocybe sulcata]|uniref:Uncharacterized protein n=1 Tax=Heliocybe sulcata TaxID=5364 RepID=A0A5C3NPK2_9AGAM|nr:hypothetical protein OE88DRAFT_1641473 [Heliocybe sulcata]